MIHGQRGVIGLARARGKQRIGGVGTADRQALRAQCRDRGFDDPRLLVAEPAAFARMRIEPAHCQARRGDPEIAAQRGVDDARAALDQVLRQQRGNLGQRAMHGQRHRAQARSGEHHHRVVGVPVAGGGEEFGLAGKVEPDLGQFALGNGSSDNRARAPVPRQRGRFDQRMQRQPRPVGIGGAGAVLAIVTAQDRQCPGKDRRSVRRIRNPLYGQLKPARLCRGFDHACPADHEKGREPRLETSRPAFGNNFGPDPRRIAKGYGEGSHGLRQLYSMKASLRRSRR